MIEKRYQREAEDVPLEDWIALRQSLSVSQVTAGKMIHARSRATVEQYEYGKTRVPRLAYEYLRTTALPSVALQWAAAGGIDRALAGEHPDLPAGAPGAYPRGIVAGIRIERGERALPGVREEIQAEAQDLDGKEVAMETLVQSLTASSPFARGVALGRLLQRAHATKKAPK